MEDKKNDNPEEIKKTNSMINLFAFNKTIIGINNIEKCDKITINRVVSKLSNIHDYDNPLDVFVETFENYYNCIAVGYEEKITWKEMSSIVTQIGSFVTDVYWDPKYSPSKSIRDELTKNTNLETIFNEQSECNALVVQVSKSSIIAQNNASSNETSSHPSKKRKRNEMENNSRSNPRTFWSYIFH